MIRSLAGIGRRRFMTALRERSLIERTTGHIPNTVKAAYIGFDPTAASLHIGNLQALIVMSHLWTYKVRPIIVLGGATGGIGDPSGREHERQCLDLAVVDSNVGLIRAQIEGLFRNVANVLHVSDLPEPIFVNNRKIYESMSVTEFMRQIGRHVRVGTLLSRDTIKRRLTTEEGIGYQEFSYQLFQAHDFLWLHEKHNCSLQIGGSDQWGNICAGCELVKKAKGKEVFGVTYPLLTNAKGEKYGKSVVSGWNKVGKCYCAGPEDCIALCILSVFLQCFRCRLQCAFEKAYIFALVGDRKRNLFQYTYRYLLSIRKIRRRDWHKRN
eukprot:TRINITY_DN2333_c0_g1_i1.p1 TRINITY_DN2333_c0_g1~~TRINITY_DN2333_c0_g1_i1.p1  ORF type:complete len:325 (+),score=26.14 TRINITY_DN2333_c0_g1_i1:65-1039(+)